MGLSGAALDLGRRGIDTITAAGKAAAALIDLRQGYFSSITDDTGFNATETADNVSIAFGAVIENAVGSSYDDILVGNAVGNEIHGGDGRDQLFGDGLTQDEILGALPVGSYAAVVETTPNEDDNDTLSGDGNDDEIYGGYGSDILDGGEGDDTLAGGDGADSIIQGEGTGIIRGDVGSDTIQLGDAVESNVVVFQAGSGHDVVVTSDTYQGGGWHYPYAPPYDDPPEVTHELRFESVDSGSVELLWDFAQYDQDEQSWSYGIARAGDAALQFGDGDTVFLGGLLWAEESTHTFAEANSFNFRLVFDDTTIANPADFAALFDLGTIAASALGAEVTSAPDEFDAGRGGDGGSAAIGGTAGVDTLAGTIGTDTITALAGADSV